MPGNEATTTLVFSATNTVQRKISHGPIWGGAYHAETVVRDI